jgi:hypothetical protein
MLTITRTNQEWTAKLPYIGGARYTGHSDIDALRGLARHLNEWYTEPVIGKMADAINYIADEMMKGTPFPYLYLDGVNLAEISMRHLGVE